MIPRQLEVRGDFGAVVELLGRADDGIHGVNQVGHVFEQLGDLLAFPDELSLVVKMLILAAATLTEDRASRSDAVR